MHFEKDNKNAALPLRIIRINSFPHPSVGIIQIRFRVVVHFSIPLSSFAPLLLYLFQSSVLNHLSILSICASFEPFGNNSISSFVTSPIYHCTIEYCSTLPSLIQQFSLKFRCFGSSWKRQYISYVAHSCNIHDDSFKPQTVAGMLDSAILSEFHVPPVILFM